LHKKREISWLTEDFIYSGRLCSIGTLRRLVEEVNFQNMR
jgi:hypothetical protein